MKKILKKLSGNKVRTGLLKLLFSLAVASFFTSCSRQKIKNDERYDLLNALSKKHQEFTIHYDSSYQITGSEGTGLFIPSNAFQFNNGTSPSGSIILSLGEFYTLEALLLNNLTTTSNGRLLQTRGMVYIKADSEGRELLLKNGAFLKINFADTTNLNGYQLFNGIFSKKGIEWSLVTQDTALSDSTKSSFNTLGIDTILNEEGNRKFKEYQVFFNIATPELGWFNCDKFYEGYDRDSFYVEFDSTFSPVIYAVLPKRRSIARIFYEDHKYSFKNLPKGEIALIYSFAKKNNEYHKFEKRVTIGSVKNVKIDFSESSLEQIRSIAQSLQWEN